MARANVLLTGMLAALAASAVVAPSASAASATCPGTFDVLHNDRIGPVQLPQGPYRITVLDTRSMGCTEATGLFSDFLEDWDGKLPRPWVTTARTRTFQAGRGSSVGFRVAPDTRPNPPTPPPSRRDCPGYFTVLHNDRIGSFAIRQGRYRITLLSYAGVTCRQAVSDLQQFLEDYDGILPRPWLLDPGTGTFTRGDRHIGFRIKAYLDKGGKRQGTYPVRGFAKCRATFLVRHSDHIGALRLARGSYDVWVRRLSCLRSSTLLARFLQEPSGDVPRPWTVNASSGTFTQGRTGTAFRLKPVR